MRNPSRLLRFPQPWQEPHPNGYARLIERVASRTDLDPPLDAESGLRLGQLFRHDALLQHRQVGPAIAVDMVRYMRRRAAPGAALAEAVSLFLLPQLEGLDPQPARKVFSLFKGVLDGWASDDAVRDLRRQCDEIWPPNSLGES